jgi:putative OPT family oligopeptide transporter
MTVCASIPAAVISMAILRGILRTGTILENNIVQTIASSGESLAAGIIFTMPALLLAGIWKDFDYWTVTLVALFGGSIGVLFMIPLRKTMIVEDKTLAYPEGVACARVLEVGQKGGAGALLLFLGLLVGLVLKFFTEAIVIVKGVVVGAFRLGNAAFAAGADISLALLGIGYIVGPNIAVLVFVGGAIAWLVGIPIYSLLYGLSDTENIYRGCEQIWRSDIRFLGVGAMVVGGLWSIFKIRKGILKGLKEALYAYKEASTKPGAIKRTEQDIPIVQVMLFSLCASLGVFILYFVFLGTLEIAFVSTIVMVISSFFFVAVASYIVGLVGSSNSPVSGMTICAVLLTSIILLGLGMSGATGMMATLVVAGVVCSAACTSGDICQDLKTGYIVGATPKKQQVVELLGVIAAAFIIAPVLSALHKSYGIGVNLPAPQASLFKSLTEAVFQSGNIRWSMMGIGVAVGIFIIIFDEILRISNSKFRAHIMPVAVGIYLPISLSVPILAGGIVAGVVGRLKEGKDYIQKGILFASGLIAGEALMGIAVGLVKSALAQPGKPETFPIRIIESDILSIGVFVLMVLLLAAIPQTKKL